MRGSKSAIAPASAKSGMGADSRVEGRWAAPRKILMSAVNLHLDFETYSELDLPEVGLDNYLQHPSTEILMLGWAINDALPQFWFPQDGPMPAHLRLMIDRPEIDKHAFNSEFERAVLKTLCHIETPIGAWVDPMIMARNASISGDLSFVGSVMDIPEDHAKIKEGRALVRWFCMPHLKKKVNVRYTRETHPEKWAEFVKYCGNDILAERFLVQKLKMFRLSEQEQKLYELDQIINERGMPVDMDFVAKATKIVADEQADLMAQARAATGCENPNSRNQLLDYLKTQGYPYGSLGARWVKKALVENEVSAAGRVALELRKKLAKSSTAKLDTLAKFVCADGRLRRQYVFYGAPRTGRWSGRAVQLQNLPRPTIKNIPGAVVAILSGDREAVRSFGPPLEVVASCLRSAFRVS